MCLRGPSGLSQVLLQRAALGDVLDGAQAARMGAAVAAAGREKERGSQAGGALGRSTETQPR